MEPPGLQPNGNTFADLPVIDAIREDAQACAIDLTDAKRLRAKLLDHADLEGVRLGAIANTDMLGADT
jgi:hypothetical protein